MRYKFLLFGFNDHEAIGGMEDFLLGFNTFDDFNNGFSFVDFDSYQLVETERLTFKEFQSKITWHVGKDDYKTIVSLRESEFKIWIKERV